VLVYTTALEYQISPFYLFTFFKGHALAEQVTRICGELELAAAVRTSDVLVARKLLPSSVDDSSSAFACNHARDSSRDCSKSNSAPS
jgi:hypothetical protein